ncbi:Phosphopantetheine attachment site [Actinokineospora alba]|uniref:Phosphopantetheine attachment site n=1 Tax=Actinokineospora alba TaxID=504798 RepID=A0A1H0HBT9_9PSEU|nr:phosphopantetheine-binding protein [Actinokineospora alba]TDP64951.1 phosphopantetheine binding protein [Actinokineospora alba]SDH50116.1 Phosphopantetheine attachment site [Actinokineospora alba]SDO16530.1 Phosphopantetheine attachment site [Actinokineospora alba]
MTTSDVIRNFLVAEFLPDLRPADLADDYDLIGNGVIDSLALIRVITWLGNEFDIDLDQVEFAEENFTSVSAIRAFTESALDEQYRAA